jgi:large subunit ribosomal protein L9
MLVLLLEDIKNLGKTGDIVDTSEGYARNFLFPQSKAALATKQVKSNKESKDAAARKKAQDELEAQQAIASRLEHTEVTITQRVKEGDELYGSVTAKDVSSLLQQEAHVKVAPRSIRGTFPFKRTGTYPVTIQLEQGVEFQMNVVIVQDGNLGQTTEDEE